MKRLCEIGAESGAAIAAILWFISARIRLSKRSVVKRGLASGIDDPRQVLLLVYQQSRWSAWAAIAAGSAALFALADGFFCCMDDNENQTVSDCAARDNRAGTGAYRNAHRCRGDVPRPTRHRSCGARTTMHRLRGPWFRRRSTRAALM